MFVPALGLYVIEIPKNGSTSLKHAIEAKHGKARLPGHLTLSEMQEHAGNHPAIAVWRDPLDRFVSQLNHSYGDNPKCTLQDAYNGWWRHRKRIVNHPQSRFLDGPVTLFPSVNDALEWLGCEPVRKNVSTHRWTRADVLSHPGIACAIDFYADDLTRNAR